MSFIEEKDIVENVRESVVLAIDFVWSYKIDPSLIKIERLKGDWHITVILYPIAKLLKLPLEDIGSILGGSMLYYLSKEISEYDVVKGFLNLKMTDDYLISRMFYVMNYCEEIEKRSVENKPSQENNYFKR